MASFALLGFFVFAQRIARADFNSFVVVIRFIEKTRFDQLRQHLTTPSPPPSKQKTLATLKRALTGHSKTVHAVCFGPDEQTLISGSRDQTIKLVDMKIGQLKASIRAHFADLRYVCISSDGQSLTSASVDRTVKLWDMFTGNHNATLRGDK